MRGVYTVLNKYSSFAGTGPFPIILGTPKQGVPVELIEAHVTFSSSTTNQQQEIRIQNVSSWSVSNYTAVTPTPVEPNDQAAQSLWYYWGGSSTFSGTLGTSTYWDEGFSTLPGWHWTPMREGRVIVNATGAQSSSGIAIVMVLTPSSIDMEVLLTFREMG